MKESSEMDFKEASRRFVDVFGEGEPLVPPIGVKLIPKGKKVPKGTRAIGEYQGVLWCEAVRIAATKGEVVVITKENVGCPAAAIALGLVDQYNKEPLSG